MVWNAVCRMWEVRNAVSRMCEFKKDVKHGRMTKGGAGQGGMWLRTVEVGRGGNEGWSSKHSLYDRGERARNSVHTAQEVLVCRQAH